MRPTGSPPTRGGKWARASNRVAPPTFYRPWRRPIFECSSARRLPNDVVSLPAAHAPSKQAAVVQGDIDGAQPFAATLAGRAEAHDEYGARQVAGVGPIEVVGAGEADVQKGMPSRKRGAGLRQIGQARQLLRARQPPALPAADVGIEARYVRSLPGRPQHGTPVDDAKVSLPREL